MDGQNVRILLPKRRPQMGAQDVREGFMTAPDAAKAMGITRNRVGRLCLEGRFPGAFKLGRVWLIPRAAVVNHRPLPPGRRRRAKEV